MFVEGYIDKEFLRVIKEAGFDVVWECKTRNDLIKHGYDTAAEKDGIDLTEKTVVRIFIEADMEDYLMPILTTDLAVWAADRQTLLPLMAVCGNERMKNYAVQELKRST
jgi:hypothetical protein